MAQPASERLQYDDVTPPRFVMAASLFDGHDASINIMRRVLQSAGVEVIHLGHNRSVNEIVSAAIQEDADAIAVSSYQGGHIEFFSYMLDMLSQRGAAHIRIFGGGGGVIVQDEIQSLHARGVTQIYSPEDGRVMGLRGIVDDMLSRCGQRLPEPLDVSDLGQCDDLLLARVISCLTDGGCPVALSKQLESTPHSMKSVPVVGITGTGGAGKSSLTDEIIRRFRLDFEDQLRIAVIAVDPSRRKSGGALLGDRIRMNSLDPRFVYMRSLATRQSGMELPKNLEQVIESMKVSGFDLVLVETSGIGQGDSRIASLVDVSLYVMTPEFGAASQLEKIDMLDFADIVVINKFDRRGASDAMRDVRKQIQRNNDTFDIPLVDQPVYGTIASRFNDDGVSALYGGMVDLLRKRRLIQWSSGTLKIPPIRGSSRSRALISPRRQRYLSEIAQAVRDYHNRNSLQAEIVRECQQLQSVSKMLAAKSESTDTVERLYREKLGALTEDSKNILEKWWVTKEKYGENMLISYVRGREFAIPITYETLSGTTLRKVSLPRISDQGDLLIWLTKENLPGYFPYTGGVFELKRESEEPSRMFAGEGDAFRTNRRFKYLSSGSAAKRLSTAFDSVTLYGFDPDERPDIYGKIGNSGVSVATLEDMQALYEGFDLCGPETSVSMTINGPAPTILAMFLNAAINQQIARFTVEHQREPDTTELLGIRSESLSAVRGTVQADILKEDQGQNTCIFSTEFSLKMMGDISEYFVRHNVKNFYSVSISGYHIAEAGANPITQLAFTLANGFTYVEAYLERGMKVDDFAGNFSFFFSNGMDPEYTVLGRVARRIWAVAMRDRYRANERSQKLKYHIQTSGRSLHSQEIDFNDIRTTLQALIATYDHCNSLHTNAYDEAITTPTEESVRRALAIQMIINREWGLAKNENPNQGSFVIDELTDLVEEAVLQEFERISERGGVLGAMETGYQRGKIQDESMLYERKKYDGSLPIVGINTFLSKRSETFSAKTELTRSGDNEKRKQINRLREFQQFHADQTSGMLKRIKETVEADANVFEVLMEAVKVCSLGQITDVLFEVGGKYRRNM